MICKWTEKNNITFEVKSVRKTTLNDQIVTKFYITDFIKNMRDSTKKYWCTVFADIKIEDGDRIKILDMDCLVTSQDPKTKKFMQFLAVVPEIVKKSKEEKKEGKIVNPYEE